MAIVCLRRLGGRHYMRASQPPTSTHQGTAQCAPTKAFCAAETITSETTSA
jgi:hypothetical protein